jgi:hypothetical protein
MLSPVLPAGQALPHQAILRGQPTASARCFPRCDVVRLCAPELSGLISRAIAALRMLRLHFWPSLGRNAHSCISRDRLEEPFSLRSQRLRFPSLCNSPRA